jgi:hypothetical protein
MSRASETAKGAAITACGRSTAEGLEGGKFAAQAREEAGLPGRGNFFAGQVGSGACGI